MPKQYTRDEAHEIVVAHLRQYKLHLGFSYKEIAEQAGVSSAYITQVLKGNFKAQGKLMEWAGLKKKVVYERVTHERYQTTKTKDATKQLLRRLPQNPRG